MYIKKVRPMNMKWKVALLTLLGFSTAACCNTKKLGKSEDAKSDPVETETEDPRIMLMYGVPFPDGQVARPVEDTESTDSAKDGVEFPDGAVVHPISEEEAQKVIEQMKAEEAAKAQENK
jgi:hypothetical protein